MLPREASRLVDEIASDRRSGALPLALEALGAYKLLRDDASDEDVEDLDRQLQAAQPWMAAVGNASSLARILALEHEWGKIDHLRAALAHARHLVAEKAAGELAGCRTVMTLSYSTDVLETLQALSKRGSGFQVYVCESRPLSEGVQLAKDFVKGGVRATVVVDAAGPGLVRECDAVLSGTDSLLRDGELVNKIGTFALALACERFGTPFHALLELIKTEVEGRKVERQREVRSSSEVARGVEARNIYFERVPMDLVPSIVTDGPFSTVEEVLGEVRNERDLLRFYLESGVEASAP